MTERLARQYPPPDTVEDTTALEKTSSQEDTVWVADVAPEDAAITPASVPANDAAVSTLRTEDTTLGDTAGKAETAAQPSDISEVEHSLSSRWIIWLGGVAFALGGAFMVKYSVDAGLLSPGVRVTLGTIFGILMTGAGEVLRQRRALVPLLRDAPDYVPSAIAAAGLSLSFTAVYAAFALYQLLPALVAFGLLALFSLASSFLALRHGRFFAILGVLGGLVTPALVSTGSGNAWALFPYLLIIVATCLWISRQRAWLEIAVPTLVLAALWVLVWIFTNWGPGDILPTGLYLILLTTANSYMAQGASPDRQNIPTLQGLMPSHWITFISDIASLVCMLLLVSIVRLDHYSSLGIMLVTLNLAVHAHAVYRSAENDVAGIFAIASILFLFSTWHVPDFFEIQATLTGHNFQQFAWSPIAPPGMEKFITLVALYALGIGSVLFWICPRLLRTGVWASVGVATPILLLIITYWRVMDLEQNLPFAMVALGLCLAFTFAVTRMRQLDSTAQNVPVAAYASGATAALALAFTMILRDAWLSFALALELVALAYIWRKTEVSGLRRLALLLAVAVLCRLFLNDAVVEYHGEGPMPVFNWLFYGYGLTAVLFAVAAKIFETNGIQDRLLTVLKAGAILLFISFISLEIRVLFSEGGTLTSEPTGFEIAVQTLNWSLATLVLLWFEIQTDDKVLRALRRVMTALSVGALLVGGGLWNNELFDLEPDDSLPLFNLNFLQLLLPAFIFAAKAYLTYKAGRSGSAKRYGAVTFLVFWLWMTVEVHQFFGSSDWKGYGYSMAWLLYAIGLLSLGLRRQVSQIRMGGLAVLSIVVLKVFLIDMSELEGLARALSFMGLGGALIGIGYLYQRIKPTGKSVSAPS
ncbi:membrane protein [Kordiimonas sediminis]|uniref:Membrane protein n=1 Tax=Kordiimonas sediminis TaxID=1735581 RepID=A0A919AMX5_9PROT|nr:DUF2339 domain-containing protein [Kordiimonas sediminis]GHF17594.1 membrane protein [Kordiimonas sediminis]